MLCSPVARLCHDPGALQHEVPAAVVPDAWPTSAMLLVAIRRNPGRTDAVWMSRWAEGNEETQEKEGRSRGAETETERGRVGTEQRAYTERTAGAGAGTAGGRRAERESGAERPAQAEAQRGKGEAEQETERQWKCSGRTTKGGERSRNGSIVSIARGCWCPCPCPSWRPCGHPSSSPCLPRHKTHARPAVQRPIQSCAWRGKSHVGRLSGSDTALAVCFHCLCGSLRHCLCRVCSAAFIAKTGGGFAHTRGTGLSSEARRMRRR